MFENTDKSDYVFLSYIGFGFCNQCKAEAHLYHNIIIQRKAICEYGWQMD